MKKVILGVLDIIFSIPGFFNESSPQVFAGFGSV